MRRERCVRVLRLGLTTCTRYTGEAVMVTFIRLGITPAYLPLWVSGVINIKSYENHINAM